MTLPPLNFTPAEAVALAVGLRRLDDTHRGRVTPAIGDVGVDDYETRAPVWE